MDYEMNSQHNMLEKPDSRIETKTAIEWENERSAHDVGLTALSSPISSNQNFLSFDAYGNLTAEKPFNDSIISSPLNQSFDFSSPTNLDPLSSADGLFIAKNNSNTPEKNTVKYSKQNKRISFSDTQLKQVIKEELPDSISTSTSRYGRERKKRTSDGFLFGTINFNELRKVTACSTTIPLSPKERGISCENSNGINFDSNPLSTNYDEIVTPGLAPPEKILTSAESSSETEDPNSKDPSISGKKKTKRVKKAALNSLPLTENKAVIHPSPNKGSLSKKLKNNKKYISGLNDTSTKCVGDIHHSNEESIDAKKKKVSESVFDKSFEKIEIESDKIKDQEESERALLLSPNKKDEKPNARKRINTFNSSEEVEVNFTPRKKKKKNSEALSFSPADDQIPPAVLFDMDSDHKNHLESEAEMSYNHTYRIDLGAVGDIVDDLRILKDLTEKNKSESLFMCKETPEEAPPLFYTEPLCKIEFPVKDSLAPSGPRKRGRPRKSLPNEPRKRIKKFTRKSIAMGELNFQNSSKSNLNNESVKNNIKTELGYEEDISNDSVLNISNNSSASVSSPISHTKRGRVVRKPNVTDIADLHERQMQARKLSRMEKEIASSAEESLLECGPPAELIADLEEKHPAEYSEGNLVWVALRGHPLWPAIIMQDYKSAQHTRLEVKQTVKGFLSHRVYHVLFLNDNLRVYWMREEYLMPYKGRTDITEHLKSVKKEFNNLKPTERAFQCLLLKSLPHFLKDAEALQASPKLVKWNSAVDEAELATALDKEDRIQKYFTLCTTSVKPEPSCIKYKKKKKKKKDDGILLSSAEIKSEPGSINGSISREASPGIDTRDRRSPSNESDFSGFEDSSSGEVQKRKIEVIKTINDGFDVFYKVKLAAYKKDHHKASDAQIRKLMLDHWTAKNQASKQKFLKTHSEYLEDSDDMLKSRFSSHDELDNQSETGGSIASRRKKSTGDDFDGARGTYRLPRNEKVCYKCEAVSAMPNAADMVRCKGSCCGFYHYSCLGLEVRPDNDKEFKCNECLTGQHLCFICKLGGRLVSRKDTKVKGGSVEKSLGNGSKVADKDVNTEPLAGDDSENKTLVPKNSSQDRKCRRKSNVKKPEKKEEHPSRNNNEMKDTEEINFACPDSVMENNSNGFPDTYLKDSEKPENSEESSRITRSGVNNKSARSEQSDLSEAIFPDTKETEENIKHEQISNLNPEAETGNVNEELNLAGNADDVVKESKPDVNTNKIDLDSSPEGISSILEADQKSQAKAENAEQDSKPEDCANSSTEEEIHRCSVVSCGKFYHLQCALRWPQVAHGWHSGKKLVCPRHMCHMCAATAEDMGYPAAKTGSFTRCLRCPATYHTGTDCLAAGSGEISLGCHVCPRHNAQAKSNHFNVTWCFGCSKGGSLVLCDECPAAYHLECLEVPPSPEEGKGFVCDDCINGKLPVYGDIVWAKIGAYRWWPGQVLHPRFIPDNIENLKHTQGMFCVHFFGSNDYYWVHRGRVFHYQDGDRGCKSYQKSSLNRQFEKALEETKIAFEEEQTNKSLREARRHEKESTKPPPFVRIDTNRPVGNVKRQELELPPKCDCDPLSASPCGPNSNCINRMLMIECAVETCAARERCCNQRFLRRQYPQLAPQRVAGRGWGLHTLQDIQAGDFVIEYVGELVDETELWRRIDYMHQINEENYYFLTITKDIIIDAGPKGNLARFMNHSCEPNCETQKWQVGSETRVGLFALCDIPAGSEVTFNYHFECVGTEKKKCNCGATNCSGYIGAKVQKIEPKKPVGFGKKKKKKKPATKVTEDECFRCGTPGDLILCDLAACPKGYHLECLGLEVLPKGKWVCPWHHCDECGNRAITRCFMCPNSFCKAHMENKMCTSSDVAGGGVSLTYCVGHSEENVREFCDLSKTAALRAQMEAARAVSPTFLEGAQVIAGAAADAAVLPLQHEQLQQQQQAAARKSKERSERARARRQFRELYNLTEMYSEYGGGKLDVIDPEQLIMSIKNVPGCSDADLKLENSDDDSDHEASKICSYKRSRRDFVDLSSDEDSSGDSYVETVKTKSNFTRKKNSEVAPETTATRNISSLNIAAVDGSKIGFPEDSFELQGMNASLDKEKSKLQTSPIINVVVNVKPRRQNSDSSLISESKHPLGHHNFNAAGSSAEKARRESVESIETPVTKKLKSNAEPSRDERRDDVSESLSSKLSSVDSSNEMRSLTDRSVSDNDGAYGAMTSGRLRSSKCQKQLPTNKSPILRLPDPCGTEKSSCVANNRSAKKMNLAKTLDHIPSRDSEKLSQSPNNFSDSNEIEPSNVFPDSMPRGKAVISTNKCLSKSLSSEPSTASEDRRHFAADNTDVPKTNGIDGHYPHQSGSFISPAKHFRDCLSSRNGLDTQDVDLINLSSDASSNSSPQASPSTQKLRKLVSNNSVRSNVVFKVGRHLEMSSSALSPRKTSLSSPEEKKQSSSNVAEEEEDDSDDDVVPLTVPTITIAL
ncbi:uncharacterized protein LOC108680821 isoform X2 [Hyalella azteca]|uniref:Uncharacterized protein LOC108680821 isoform X2 n=1 Tax=Hyalella azteca TaxID=294128 RepID=A0A8B7PI70_HYAAZ|nr:uncharacterized protein LOC108680821 isoform X2 [Hyalella azteca]